MDPKVEAHMMPLFTMNIGHFAMKCSFLQDFDHYCHDMLVFRCFCNSRHLKVRRSFAQWSCWPPFVVPFGALLALVPDRRFCATTNGTPPDLGCDEDEGPGRSRWRVFFRMFRKKRSGTASSSLQAHDEHESVYEERNTLLA